MGLLKKTERMKDRIRERISTSTTQFEIYRFRLGHNIKLRDEAEERLDAEGLNNARSLDNWPVCRLPLADD